MLAATRHWFAFLIPVTLGVGVFALSGVAFLHFFTSSDVRALEQMVGQKCAGLTAYFLNGLSSPHILAAALTFAVIVAFAVSLARQARATRRYTRSLRPATETGAAPNLELALTRLGLTRDCVRIVENDAALCFNAGFIRPKIYLSTGTLNLLNQRELMAVMAHESYHLHKRDPARQAVLRALRQSLFFLPIMKSLEARHSVAKEVAADAEALHHAGGRLALAGALYKLTAPRAASPAGLAFFAEHGLLEIRISIIEGKRARLTPFAASRLASTFVVLAALFAVLVPRAHAESPPPGCEKTDPEQIQSAAGGVLRYGPALEYAVPPPPARSGPAQLSNIDHEDITHIYAEH